MQGYFWSRRSLFLRDCTAAGQEKYMIEKELSFIPNQCNLSNEDVRQRIFERGAPEELEQARASLNLTPEQIKLFCDYAKLRKKTREQMRQELAERIKENPNATQEELNMGCYQENIEPQVRGTILNLRCKGYATYESGFHGHNSQKIGFEKNHLENVQFPEELLREFEDKGVNIKVKPNALSFTCNSYFELEELEKFWKQIENILPSLQQQPAEPCNTQGARLFREKHS
jgi:hypothetical protein